MLNFYAKIEKDISFPHEEKMGKSQNFTDVFKKQKKDLIINSSMVSFKIIHLQSPNKRLRAHTVYVENCNNNEDLKFDYSSKYLYNQRSFSPEVMTENIVNMNYQVFLLQISKINKF